MTTPLFQHIARSIQALKSCQESPVNEFGARIHSEALEQFESLLPSGSGIDCGTKINIEKSTSKAIWFSFSFHHMNDVGMYNGWTDHELVLTPSLQSAFDLRITGKDRNQIKDYLYEVYQFALSDEIDSEVSGDGADREVKWFSVSMRDTARKFQEGIANGTIV
jgi:hypothetical protein